MNAFVETKRIIGHHISSFNQFVNEEMENIVAANSTVHSQGNANWYLKFVDVRFMNPLLDDDCLIGL